MFRSTRRLLPLLAFVLVAVAIFGYTAGYRRAPATAPTAAAHRETVHTISDAGMLLEYPAGWQPAKALVAVPGLALAHPLLLAPGGDVARAGLLSGQLPAGEPGPLPARLRALLRGTPNVEVVNLIDGQAFRYGHVGLAGYDRALDLYVILYAGKSPTALACYAPPAAASTYLSECDQIVAGLTPLGQSSTYDLTPDTGYAQRLERVIEGLNGERATLRAAMRTHASPAAVGRLATALAGRFAAAAASLAPLEAPPVAGPAQTALASAILGARDAYRSLAATAIAPGQAARPAALTQVDAAEASVDAALEDFALLGYGRPR